MSTNSHSLPQVALNRVSAIWAQMPTPRALRRFRSGSVFTRFIRHIFEHNAVHKILGSNLALAVVASSLLQNTFGTTKLEFVSAANPVISAETIKFTTERGVTYPVATVKINQKYSVFHPGIDLDGNTGDPVRPIMAGRVESTQHSRFAYGNAIIVNHGNDLTSLYAHLSKINVKVGDTVTHESVIGNVGSTGRSTGDHLHIEIRQEGRALNPLSVLSK